MVFVSSEFQFENRYKCFEHSRTSKGSKIEINFIRACVVSFDLISSFPSKQIENGKHGKVESHHFQPTKSYLSMSSRLSTADRPIRFSRNNREITTRSERNPCSFPNCESRVPESRGQRISELLIFFFTRLKATEVHFTVGL